jgi:hypothetical protein
MQCQLECFRCSPAPSKSRVEREGYIHAALLEAGRADMIGRRPHCLIP